MTAVGTDPRTAAVRARNRANAWSGPQPCADNCTCGRHRAQVGRPGRPCKPDCTCGRHTRAPEHNARIGMSVLLTLEAKRNVQR